MRCRSSTCTASCSARSGRCASAGTCATSCASTPRRPRQALTEGGTMLFGVPTMYHRIAAEAEADPDGRRRPALRAAARLRLGAAAGAAVHAHQAGDRPGGRRALRPHRDAHEHRGPRRRRAQAGLRRAARSRASTCASSSTRAATSTDFDGETIGEIAVRGPNVFTGYLNRPDATAEAMRDGWFFTGDIATRTADGYVRIVGRRSTDLIKTGGYKVGAGEIEVVAARAPGGVGGRGDRRARRGPRRADHRVDRRRRTAPRRRTQGAHRPRRAAALAPHKRPREVHFLDELPRNAMGKVVKQRLGVVMSVAGRLVVERPAEGVTRPADRAPRAARGAVAGDPRGAVRGVRRRPPTAASSSPARARSSPPATT